MKKLTVLFAAVLCAAMSFADCNEYGWTCAEDMYKGLAEDVWAYHNDASKASTFGITKFDTVNIAFHPSDLVAGTGIAFDVEPWDMNFFNDSAMAAKWGWLVAYMDTACAHAGQGLASSGQAQMRYNLTAFFSDGYRDSWPKSADYATIGVSNFLAWQPSWGSSWCIKEVCNDYGWMSADDMYKGLAEDVWAYHNDASKASTFGITKFDTVNIAFHPSDLVAGTGIAFDVEPWDMNFFNDSAMAAKWGWLVAYMDTACAHAGQGLASSGQAQMRYNLTAFFSDGYRDSWPKSADYATIGISNFVAWQPYWGQKWCTGGATVTVTYDLQGGVTNDYGWTSPADMGKAFIEDYNAVNSESLDVEDMAHIYNIAENHALLTTVFEDATYGPKWEWLKNYLSDKATEMGKDGFNYLKDHPSIIRGFMQNFFNNEFINQSGWNAAMDGTKFGIANLTAWQGYWKHAFDNPTEFAADAEFDLNAPYKEGEAFRGWFLDALGQGQEVTKMSSVYAGQTIYAVFGEYQPTIKEIRDTTLYTIGDIITTTAIVTAVSGKNVYIADASGMGILAYYGESQQNTLTAGKLLTVKGELAEYNGFPELKNCETKAIAEAGLMINPTIAALTDLKAAPLKFYGLPVLVKDIRISKYDADGNMYVSDGVIEIEAYYIRPDQTEYKVGQRINLTAVVGNYKTDIQFIGTVDGIEKLVFESTKDPNTYAPLTVYDEAIGDSIRYNIESNWIFSAQVGNWEANKPAAALEQCRGMVVKDGIIYFTWRNDNNASGRLKLIRYDAATGEKLTDLILAEYIFRQPAVDTTENPRWYLDEGTGLTYIKDDYEWNYAEFNQGYTFGPNTGMYMDEAGHILVADLPTSGTEYQVWMIDETTGEGQLVIYCGGNSGASTLKERYPDDADIRLDRFGVAGDVTKDATIFTVNMNSDKVYTFDIYDGKWDGEMWQTAVGGGSISNYGQAPQINPVDGGASFYVSGTTIYPTLASAEDGTILESFNGVFDEEENPIRESCLSLLYNEAGSSAAKVAGCREFKVGGAYFFSMSAATWEGGYTPYNSHLLFRFKDENRHFDEMTRWTELPKDGFGTIEGVKNFQFTNIHYAVQKDELSTELYIWTAEYGLAKYTITADKTTGLQDVKAINADNTKVQKVIVDGQLYIIRNGVSYTAMGQVVE